jgi:peptidoglycan/xylan/chitin deacetylase (PgdA/CDA1 family)
MATSPRPLILAYHAVSSAWRSPLAVSEDTLRAQLGYLAGRRYVGMTFSEAERRRNAGQLPERTVVVTFDDGYASNLHAVPVLEEFGYPATVFVVTSFVESGRLLSWYGIDGDSAPSDSSELVPLSWDDLGRLRDAGWEVGSHTVTHPLLTTLDGDQLAAELLTSRTSVREHLGSCDSLAYPYGAGDHRTAGAAEAAGFHGACVLTGAHLDDRPYLRPRVGLTDSDTGKRLALKLSRAGLAFRRSPVALAVRKSRRRRSWQPPPRTA